MLSAEDNEVLSRTGPQTPMGQYFRRFWQPIALSRELPDRDGAPKRITIMGETLIAFRNTAGVVGLVDSKCPHRGADLYFARNEDCAIRCVYHGWKFDVEGRAVELPNVPPSSNYHATMRLKAYPTKEYGGMIWAYLGPTPEQGQALPEIPMLEFGTLPESHYFVTKKLQECNWAQSVEGALDTSHFSFLHMPAPHIPSPTGPGESRYEKTQRWMREDPQPEFSILEHEVGFVVGGARKVEAAERYWRTAQFALPSHCTAPPTFEGETYYGYTWVPIDDFSCWTYTYAWNPEHPLSDEERALFNGSHRIFTEIDDNYVPLRNRSNQYKIDRQMQKHINFTGVTGVADQDAMIQDSQGFIADRTKEHLSASDAAVVRFRRNVLQGAKALLAGTEPDAPRKPECYALRSGSWIGPANATFEQSMVARFGHRTGRAVAANHRVKDQVS
ncbi:MAG: ring-hydroxylating oxygenase subunit alpha [Paucimonas sp.]|nr:ring-hydroxylating oxygenase subunit alpha [Paucimonas sp.]